MIFSLKKTSILLANIALMMIGKCSSLKEQEVASIPRKKIERILASTFFIGFLFFILSESSTGQFVFK